jgi:predicted transcriptional regulator
LAFGRETPTNRMSVRRRTVLERLATVSDAERQETTTVEGLIAALDADPATVNAHLDGLSACDLIRRTPDGRVRVTITGEQLLELDADELVELGLLRQSELNREGGGVVNVYHSVDLERMRRETLIGFYVWAGEAAALIENANLTKQDYLDENPDQELPEVFWESFSDE